MAHLNFDPEDFLDEVSSTDLQEELEGRGYTVIYAKIKKQEKTITDRWKDEEISKVYHELSWEEWKEMISGFLAEKKGKELPV